jgi:2,4-dienoyl-CoA reductase-like NADH-dependent reductase (Old Yellow Enzyme family)/thioredoxin reductase
MKGVSLLMEYKHLFTPYKIGKCVIPNRLVVPAMVTNMNPDDGKSSKKFISHYTEKAKGGWGLIITENFRVSRYAGGFPSICSIFNKDQVSSHKKLTAAVHRYESKIFCQIYHAGRQTNRQANGGARPVSCSPIPCPWNKDIPRELKVEEIRQIVKDFGIAAANVVEAGFDGVEIHAANGYLIHQFLSPNSNKRTDEYGGTHENRTRLLREIMTEVRRNIGTDFPMQVRVSAAEHVAGGGSLFERRQIFRDIEDWGADSVHVSFGMYGTPRSELATVSSFYQNHGWAVKYAKEVKSILKIPVICVGRIQEPSMAEDILSEGMADFIGMARASLSDPYWPEKVKNRKVSDIRPCIGCLEGCIAATAQKIHLRCLVNPELGYEDETDYTKASSPKRVMVVGGGIAGMEAARAASIKGHDVDLFEASDYLGGQFLCASYPPHKGDFSFYPAWLIRQLKQLNVRIHMNTPVTCDLVKERKPDKLILATGAKAKVPVLPGIEKPNVFMAEDVLMGRIDPGMRVVIIGGGLIGSETAAMLSTQFKTKVTLVVKYDEIDIKNPADQTRNDLKHFLAENFVEVVYCARLTEVRDEGAVIEKDGVRKLYPCDGVVLATGMKAYNPLGDMLKNVAGIDFEVVGDAVAPRRGVVAAREGFMAGLSID